MSPRDMPQNKRSAALSHELCDAATELACRIELGEFDDLDETQMGDLRALASVMASWAARAQELEQGQTDQRDSANTGTALLQPIPRAGSIYRN